MAQARRFTVTLSMALACYLVSAARAADSAPGPKTWLAERGQLLVSDDLKQPLASPWRIGKGEWKVVAGALQAQELPADKHVAVARYALQFDDAVIQYAFKLEAGSSTTLSINTAKAHLCRVLISPAGFVVRKDDMDKAGPDKAAVLHEVHKPIEPGVWHTLVVEIRGQEMLAALDGEHIAFGQHEAIAAMKANFGLTVAGKGVAFKEVRVWEAMPNKGWEATKAKLQGGPKTVSR